MRKYGNKPVVVDGRKFDSQAEYRRFLWLQAEQALGRISALEVHPVYALVVNGQPICKFIPDFRFVRDGHVVIQDVKSPVSASTKSPVGRIFWLKAKLLQALEGVMVEVVA